MHGQDGGSHQPITSEWMTCMIVSIYRTPGQHATMITDADIVCCIFVLQNVHSLWYFVAIHKMSISNDRELPAVSHLLLGLNLVASDGITPKSINSSQWRPTYIWTLPNTDCSSAAFSNIWASSSGWSHILLEGYAKNIRWKAHILTNIRQSISTSYNRYVHTVQEWSSLMVPSRVSWPGPGQSISILWHRKSSNCSDYVEVSSWYT